MVDFYGNIPLENCLNIISLIFKDNAIEHYLRTVPEILAMARVDMAGTAKGDKKLTC